MRRTPIFRGGLCASFAAFASKLATPAQTSRFLTQRSPRQREGRKGQLRACARGPSPCSLPVVSLLVRSAPNRNPAIGERFPILPRIRTLPLPRETGFLPVISLLCRETRAEVAVRAVARYAARGPNENAPRRKSARHRSHQSDLTRYGDRLSNGQDLLRGPSGLLPRHVLAEALSPYPQWRMQRYPDSISNWGPNRCRD